MTFSKQQLHIFKVKRKKKSNCANVGNLERISSNYFFPSKCNETTNILAPSIYCYNALKAAVASQE